jgi:sulfopyruvate decarboxylase subunit beta
MTVDEAIVALLRRYPGAFVVSTCGYISRDLFRISDCERHFYMLGSMGIAAPLALGVALARSDATVLALDGDAAFVMNLGAVAMIAAERPPRLVHAVLDNGLHESTGAQRAVPMPDTEQALRLLGYEQAYVATDAESIEALPKNAGPLLVRVPVARRHGAPGGRVSVEPHEIAERFATALAVTSRPRETDPCA